nr:hypothetical protein CKG001_00740 [Bdellovibrio sp. CKG001]
MLGVEMVSAADLGLRYYDSIKKTYKPLQVIEKDGVTISKSCLKSGKMKCQAWDAVLNKKALTPTPGVGVVGNPAARYCHDYNANNLIVLDAKKNEYDYCVFSDGSMIDSWSLYYKHFKK